VISDKPDRIFEPVPNIRAWANLQSYNFTESVDDINGSFSFSIENGKSIFDLIPLRSIIKIYEGGDHPVFVGIIRRRKFGKQMTNQGVKHTIVFSGKSIISCVSEYVVSLDVRIRNVASAAEKSTDLSTKLAEATTISQGTLSIADFIKITYDYFKEVSLKINEIRNGITNTAVGEVINKYLGQSAKDFVTVTGSEHELKYNIATVFFNAQNNNIVDVWRNILPRDAYEIFAYCDNEGNPKIMIRITPFGNPLKAQNDWNNLDPYVISPISLTAFELDQNDENVYTLFASYIVGSQMSREFYSAVTQAGPDDRVRYNDEKLAVYGFRPLAISFMGYDRKYNQDAGKQKSNDEAVKELNELARYWYSRNDDMYSGSITMITDFKNPKANPKVGCRAKFLGGEFYINKTEHSWNFGSTPITKLSVSRGMVYDKNGIMRDGEAGIIKDVGKRYKELERQDVNA
jgi:hypothetical protein